IFIEQLESVLQGSQASIRHSAIPTVSLGFIGLYVSSITRFADKYILFFCLLFSCEQVNFLLTILFRLLCSQFCKASVEPMGEESDHVHIIALSDALGVPIRVVYLDRSSCDPGAPTVNHHDFMPNESSASNVCLLPRPRVTLLYRPGHYDILYPK
ncbi:hypothetical protein GW17_00014924, partial [Ensete ventricosum]